MLKLAFIRASVILFPPQDGVSGPGKRLAKVEITKDKYGIYQDLN